MSIFQRELEDFQCNLFHYLKDSVLNIFEQITGGESQLLFPPRHRDQFFQLIEFWIQHTENTTYLATKASQFISNFEVFMIDMVALFDFNFQEHFSPLGSKIIASSCTRWIITG